tara:strand:- start:123 stop:251 length:129 start_codon:yes stop_codon:yes gene_type:complete
MLAVTLCREDPVNKRGFETWLVMAFFILCAVLACSKMGAEAG